MADVKWIKVSTNMFETSRKIKQIELMPEGDTILVIWLKLLLLAGNVNDGGAIYITPEIPYTEEMLANELRRPLPIVRMALSIFERFGMVEITDDILRLSSWEKYQNTDRLAELREYNRLAQQRSRAKKKALPPANDIVNDKSMTSQCCHDTDIDIEEEKDIDKEIDKKNRTTQPSKADVDAFFESIWNLYPVKKGKGQVSDTKRKELYKIGFDKMEQAINRYLQDLKKDASWRKPQNGSTFFNSGYVDYLDENYVPDQTMPGGRKEKLPDWFGKRELDEDEIAAVHRMMMSEDDLAEAEQLRRELQESFGGK